MRLVLLQQAPARAHRIPVRAEVPAAQPTLAPALVPVQTWGERAAPTEMPGTAMVRLVPASAQERPTLLQA